MKKLLAVAVALVVIGITGATALADESVGMQNRVSARIQTMGAMGNGLAISQTNPMDFEMLKIGIAGVRVAVSDAEETVNIGVLYFGETKYKLRDVVIGNGTASASVYDANNASAGSITLSSYPKGDTEIWAGTLSLNGTSYNAYVIQAKKLFKPAEAADNVKEYCANNPAKCMATMKAVGSIICDPQANETCSDKIKIFCESHPDDNRCKVIGMAYCGTHLNDSTCRAEITDKCKQNSTVEQCDKLTEMYDKHIEKTQNVVGKVPAWMNSVKERLKNRAVQVHNNAEGAG
jgi:hypothetical protein